MRKEPKNTIASIMDRNGELGSNQSSSNNQIRLAGLEEESIVDGPGIRLTIFTQGCPHHCKGCHNPETHDFEGGQCYSLEHILGLYDANPLLQGITFSGGEPFVQADILSSLAKAVHARGGDVVTYTGYTFEYLMQAIRNKQVNAKEWEALLQQTDLLIDGPYIEELRDLELTFRGSTNQRLLDRAARNKCCP